MNDIDNAKKNGEVDVLKTGRESELAGREDSAGNLTLRSFRNEAEIRAVNYALEQAGWNRRRAAKLLSISYRSLLYKIRQHNITRAVGSAKQLSHR
ncbi:MAG TPA: helix-turn-helix domain-containing protein [Candidatus Sulfotelmatobacter sp.]|nr:helix-turn-helix domain-containing protein [Candidatus Sulfotelmatobacter sp.]